MYTNFHVHLFQSLKSTPFKQGYERITLHYYLQISLTKYLSTTKKQFHSKQRKKKEKKENNSTTIPPQENYPTNLKRLILSLIGSRRHRVNYSLEGIFSTSEATSTSQLRISSLTRFQGALMPPDY